MNRLRSNKQLFKLSGAYSPLNGFLGPLEKASSKLEEARIIKDVPKGLWYALDQNGQVVVKSK